MKVVLWAVNADGCTPFVRCLLVCVLCSSRPCEVINPLLTCLCSLFPFATPLPPSYPQVGKETGGKKLEEPHGLKANEMAEVVFEPCQPLVVDHFKACEGLSRIAFLDGNTAVMLGKVVAVSHK